MRFRLPGGDLRAVLGDAIPSDHSRQFLADQYIERLVDPRGPALDVLDLGCGAGDSVDQFRAHHPDTRWTGLDLPRSPEVDARTRTDAAFATFDGVAIPFADASFDLVYCKQVLEHVERQRELIVEVSRVLRPGGHFAGSTSQLEPFHSLSTFNSTPYGLKLLLEDAGLQLLEIRPGIDAATLTARRLARGAPVFARWWDRDSPPNRAIALAARAAGADAAATNAAKLLLAGQFAFLARAPL